MLATAVFLCALASAQPEPVELSGAAALAVVQPAPPPTTAPKTLHLLAGTQVEVELVDTLSSRASKLGDRFAIRLVQPISVQGGVDLVAAGATGRGEIIDVARAGLGGRQGKLIISARSLDFNGRQVRIRGMTILAGGESRVDLATAMLLTPYLGFAAPLVPGGDIEIPAGTRATVRLAEDLDLPVDLTMQTIIQEMGKL